MKILILGGTGAIGVDLVRILSENNNDVYVTSRSQQISKNNNTHYIIGNAQDSTFLKEVLAVHYDAIVDFMSYSTVDFKTRVDSLLEATEQYIFLSSSRVYADADYNITEKSSRLLDVCKDKEYLESDEYALAKARQENILRDTGRKNWTIIRPYITYSNIRFQLGIYEKELWLYRALHGRTIVFSDDIASKITTLTFGRNVSQVIAGLIGNPKAIGEEFHIMQTESLTWGEILDIYLDVIEKITGVRPHVMMVKDSIKIGKTSCREHQIKYDRLFNRKFNNAKVMSVIPYTVDFITTENGLKECLEDFLKGDRIYREMSWRFEGYADKVAGEHTPLKEIPTIKEKIKYLVARYTSYFER